MKKGERQPAQRGVFLGLAPVTLAHPDLDGWEPILGALYAAPDAVADVVEVRTAGAPGDIDGQRRLVVDVLVKEPGKRPIPWAWPYRPVDEKEGEEPLQALRSDFEQRLKTKDLAQIAENASPEKILSEPANLPNRSARKALHHLVQIERSLEDWDRYFADHPLGPLQIASLRQLVEDAYRVGRWAREMELAPVLQPKLDRRKASKDLRSLAAKKNGLGQSKVAKADLWRVPCLDRAKKLRSWNPRLPTGELARQLRLWALAEERFKIVNIPDDRRFRVAVEKWEAEGTLPKARP